MNSKKDLSNPEIPAIEVKDLKFIYPTGQAALDGVTFAARPSESLVLMGANGAGKSTLLLCVIGILKGVGEIRVEGMTLGPENEASIRQRVGLVFQNPEHQLFSTSVLDDVIFGPLNLGLSRETAIARVDALLDELNMAHLRNRVPHHLSQGEKKKVAIATALAMKPSILLLDEPTAALDPRSSTQLIDILFHLKSEGKTMIMATHDMHLAEEVADRILVLGENGRIVEEGVPSRILTDMDLLARYNLIHKHGHAHDTERHGHPHFHLHKEDEQSHPH